MSDIKQILSLIDSINEGSITPVNVQRGLNKQQRSAPQLPALFKPRDISTVLGAKKDPEHPAKKFFVGGESIDESITQEDILSTVKRRLGDYLKNIEQELGKDTDLQKPQLSHYGDIVGPPVKTIKTDDGHEFKIHGNEDDGFRISVKDKLSKSKFNNLDHAVMAVEMFCNRRKVVETDADYLEEK